MSPFPALRHLAAVDTGDVTVVNFRDKTITEELNIHAVGEELYRLVDESGRRKVLVNFQNVDFMSSGMLGKLPALQNHLQAVQGKLVLCAISPKLMKLFYVTKLDLALTIVADEPTGLTSF